ncbi:RNA polymerase sigma factor [Streptomyces sp. Tue6028]|uniref:RNA polymerase sigma factor n=1 Tax=Streptomyces sp. Tue6028 TaxID=2036037 RepID=UPI00211C92F8|nr:sigma-70 family RNA polymerase sigma factor [Streptomyces sp. Tue6028]
MSPQITCEITPPGAAEPECVARARAGDRAAFAALYEEHWRSVYRYLLLRTRNRHLAEDLTQEVFARALRRIGTFTWQGVTFAAWLLTIARNLHLDEVRTSRTRLETLVPEPADVDGSDRSAESSALRVLEAVEACDAVRNALNSLSPHQRQCLELRFLGGMSPAETARTMGRSVGAVRGLTFRALRKVRTSTEANAA